MLIPQLQPEAGAPAQVDARGGEGVFSRRAPRPRAHQRLRGPRPPRPSGLPVFGARERDQLGGETRAVHPHRAGGIDAHVAAPRVPQAPAPQRIGEGIARQQLTAGVAHRERRRRGGRRLEAHAHLGPHRLDPRGRDRQGAGVLNRLHGERQVVPEHALHQYAVIRETEAVIVARIGRAAAARQLGGVGDGLVRPIRPLGVLAVRGIQRPAGAGVVRSADRGRDAVQDERREIGAGERLEHLLIRRQLPGPEPVGIQHQPRVAVVGDRDHRRMRRVKRDNRLGLQLRPG